MRTEQASFTGQTSNGRPHLSAEQHELLRTALTLKMPDDRAPDLRPAIRKIVDICGSADTPEQILVAFKNSLDDLANAARIPFGPERNERLTGLVSAFIAEMYSRGPIIRDGACRGVIKQVR